MHPEEAPPYRNNIITSKQEDQKANGRSLEIQQGSATIK